MSKIIVEELEKLIEQLNNPDLAAEEYPPTAPSRLELWRPIYNIVSTHSEYEDVFDVKNYGKVSPYALIIILRMLRALYDLCKKETENCTLQDFVRYTVKYDIYFVNIWGLVTS